MMPGLTKRREGTRRISCVSPLEEPGATQRVGFRPGRSRYLNLQMHSLKGTQETECPIASSVNKSGDLLRIGCNET